MVVGRTLLGPFVGGVSAPRRRGQCPSPPEFYNFDLEKAYSLEIIKR